MDVVVDVVGIFSKISDSKVPNIGGAVNIKFCFKELWNIDCCRHQYWGQDKGKSMNSFGFSDYSSPISDWFPNCQQSLESNCHDQEAVAVDGDVLHGVHEVGEEKDVGNRVFINKVVGNNDNKEEHIDDSKGDETLKVIFPLYFISIILVSC